MHKFPSTYAIRRIRLAALLLGAKCLLFPAALGVLIYAVAIENQQLTYYGLGLLILTGITVIFQWHLASRANCPLCQTPVLADKGCVKHRNAKPLFGSHRLRVALSVLFLNQFRCPYCGEPSVMQVRDSRRRRNHPGS